MNSDGSNEKFVVDKGEYPMFSKDGKRIFLQTGGTYFGEIEKKLISVNLEGNDEKIHLTSKYANRLIPSPNNEWIAFTNLHKLYVAPLVLNGHTIDLDDKTKALPVSQLAKDAGINIHWSSNSQKVMWTLGDEYFSNELKNRFTFLEGSPEEVPEITLTGTKIGLQAPVDKPRGRIAFTNARIITMENDEVIENGTILINGNKIEAISTADKVSIPSGTKIYSAEGKTIMPGMVDAHAHVGAFRYGLPTQQYWPFMANLAFGVTTSHDPSANTETVFTLSELQKSGQLVGPRLFSTFYHNITQVIDGHTGVEHNIPVAPVYKDIIEVWGKSGTGYTPTLIVNYGGMNGEFYYYERDNVWENEKLLTFTPRSIVDSRSRHRIKSPKDEYENGHILVSETAKTLSNAGVKVNMGAHGQLQGLGAHWETWMLQQGGMSNLEALKAATINSAEYIGAGEDIGSLKVGKLADLIVLDKNPLEDIENTESIKMVMINGRIYDAETMNEIGNNTKERLPFFWEMDKYNQAFPWHQETHGFMDGGCSCH